MNPDENIDVARYFAEGLGFPVLTTDIPAIVAAVHRHYQLGRTEAMPRATGLVLAEREACAQHIEQCEPPVADTGNRVEIGKAARNAFADSVRARGQREGI